MATRNSRAAAKRAPRKPRSQIAPAAKKEESAKSHALARRIGSLTLEKKATDVVVLDMRGMASYADFLVLASGESERQVSAMAEHVREQLSPDGVRPLGAEGLEIGQWVLLDYGEVVAHLFFTEARDFYDLEGLWVDAPRESMA